MATGSLASLLAETLYHITKGTTRNGISCQLRDRYPICRCCWKVATYKWTVHNGRIEIIYFFDLNRQPLSILNCWSMYEADLAVWDLDYGITSV